MPMPPEVDSLDPLDPFELWPAFQPLPAPSATTDPDHPYDLTEE